MINIVYNVHRYINYTISVLEGFLQSPILRGLLFAFYIVAPEGFRKFNYQRTKKYIGNLQ